MLDYCHGSLLPSAHDQYSNTWTYVRVTFLGPLHLVFCCVLGVEFVDNLSVT